MLAGGELSLASQLLRSEALLSDQRTLATGSSSRLVPPTSCMQCCLNEGGSYSPSYMHHSDGLGRLGWDQMS